MRRKTLRCLVVLCVCGSLAWGGRSAGATVVPVVDIPHTIETILHYIARLKEIAQKAQMISNQVKDARDQYTQIRNQVEQIQRQLQALKKLEHPNWREVASLSGVLDDLLRREGALAYTLADIDGRLRDNFPGAVPFRSLTDLAERNGKVITTLRNGIVAANRAGRLITDQYTLGDIKTTVAGIKGTQEALEVLATIGVFGTEEQLLTRQHLLSLINMQNVTGLAALQERESAAASLVRIAERDSGPAPARPTYTAIPAWWPY
ncbi:MAG TPA: hypothetical protein VGS22_29265 [Thermoanaerobaculia bacterium]|jgi:P-type conjugative transfer protein TrbJ|nr:hypothetical protein [Thermoanaerobaculia bacterium]